MRKMRNERYFICQDLKTTFCWIKTINGIKNFIPSSAETYYIEFTKPLEYFKYQYNLKKLERERFEKFVSDFYEVDKGKHQIIYCWRETELIIIVFKTFN